ncbi:MAG TPA: DUF2059 domain-containing protein [Longimicrobiaceae bacterium]|nr:DUF2059 domain-containing protein [Longimicrobiaceae bacterium]
MKKLVVAAVLALALAGPAFAQPERSPSHLQAAGELVDLLKLERSMMAGIEMMLQAQTTANPEMAQFEDVMREFMARYLAWERIRPEFMALYAELYTEPELRQIITFYRSPIGQKMIDNEPQMMQRAGEIGERKVVENMPELMRMLTERMAQQQNTRP